MPVKIIKTSSEMQCKIGLAAIALSALLASPGWVQNLNHNGDWDRDGLMDPTVYCEATGEWRILQSNNHYELLKFYWGGPGWTAIQSDYDGDGQADLVLYNRSSGEWGIVLSSNAYQSIICMTFGGEGWTPVTGDYDGDFLADPAIYCEATGEWRIKASRFDHRVVSFFYGGPGYTAVSGDYDADGLSDPGICLAADGQWLVALSSKNYTTVSYYVNTMGDGPLVPSPADYDGDRKTDPAIYAYSAPSHKNKYYVFAWHLLHSSENYRQVEPFYQLGREDCKPSNADPAPGDYDGDCRADFGVSWPDTTMWRMWCSGNNYESHDDSDWGDIGFRPVQR